MERTEWLDLLTALKVQAEVMAEWPVAHSVPGASRCEESPHHTLAHLRACQEQWRIVAEAFLQQDEPRITILHPWRHFEAMRYDQLPWEVHLLKFLEDRSWWLELREFDDWNRGGHWNRKPDTVARLTKRLAVHEAHHIRTLHP